MQASTADELLRLRALIDSAAAGIVVQDADGRIVDCNPEAEHLLGLTRAQMLGRASVDAHWQAIRRDGSPWPGHDHPAMHTLRTGEPLRRQVMGLALPEGGRRWIEIQSRLLDGHGPRGVVTSFIDVTAREQAETTMRRTHEQWRGLFTLSPLGIALRDLDSGRYVDVNEALLALSGYAREEVLALPPDALTAAPHRAEAARQRARLREVGRSGPWETELLRKDGRGVQVLESGMHVPQPDGRAVGWTIIQDISPRKALERELRSAARTDRLTGLPNRALLMERLEHAVAACLDDRRRHFALLFLDFDRFKLVNDTLGHEAGDQLLRMIAERLRGSLRASDLVGGDPDGNLVARFGGDEFVVLLNDAQHPDDAASVAQRLLQVFAAPYFIRDKEIHSSVSIGIVMGGDGAEGAEGLLRNADTAMYEAKRAGRGRAVFFDDGMHVRLTRALAIEAALRQAVERGQLSLVYQPIVDLTSGAVSSAEALLRWRHPELGQVSPAEFIPVAEESGLIVPIGEWVLREACAQWARWHAEDASLAPATLSVNLSRVQMNQPDRLVAAVSEVLREQGIPPGRLQLEVTEREVMHEPAAMRDLMHRLRDLGVRLAMDDFGTGTSSLGCLRDYPFDVVKIDKSFLADLQTSADVMAVLHATVTVIENLGMTSVAEGVEDEGQVAMLQSIGCRYAQGYLFARPLPPDQLLALVHARRPAAPVPAA